MEIDENLLEISERGENLLSALEKKYGLEKYGLESGMSELPDDPAKAHLYFAYEYLATWIWNPFAAVKERRVIPFDDPFVERCAWRVLLGISLLEDWLEKSSGASYSSVEQRYIEVAHFCLSFAEDAVRQHFKAEPLQKKMEAQYGKDRSKELWENGFDRFIAPIRLRLEVEDSPLLSVDGTGNEVKNFVSAIWGDRVRWLLYERSPQTRLAGT